MKYLILVVIPLLCYACATVVDTNVRVDPVLAKTSDTILLQTSALKISPKRFHQPVLRYQLENARQSWTSYGDKRLTKSTTQSVQVERSFIEWLLSEDIYPWSYTYSLNQRTYEVESKSTFGFSLADTSSTIIVSCGSFYLDEGQTETAHYLGSGNHSSQDDNHLPDDSDYFRVSTFISCEMKHGAQVSLWSLELPFQQEPQLVKAPEGKWKVNILRDFDQHLSDGRVISSDQFPSWRDKIAGLELQLNNSSVGAISLVDKKRIWIKRDLSIDQHQQATAFLLALFMLNDMDSGWH